MAADPYINASDYITLEAKTFGHHQHQRGPTSYLCGDEPPQIIDGYGKWTVIDRPLLQGITVPQGYNPAQLKVQLRAGVWDGRFGWDGWDISPTAGKYVENTQIDDLHWMAGGNAVAGPSPGIFIEAYDASQPTKKRSDLIPKQYHGVLWVINGGITWGKSLREQHGFRVYQEIEFTLLGYSGVAGGPTVPRETAGRSGGFFRTTHNVRTMLAIAGAPSSRNPEAFIERLANMIRTSPRNNPIKGTRIHLARRALNWRIPVGKEVWVPGRSF